MENFAWEASPTTGTAWRSSSPESRNAMVGRVLSQDARYAFLEVSRTLDDGSVFLFSDARLTASIRGPLLRCVESLLKEALDPAITVWIEPMDDKNALRRLRGVTLVPDGTASTNLPLIREAGKAPN